MELKRCLRCGSNHVEAENSDSFVGVFCHDCPCAVEDYSLSFEELINVWNTRPIEDKLLELIKNLGECLEGILEVSWPVDGVEPVYDHYQMLADGLIKEAKEAFKK
jgi:hypothetical protein